MFCPFCGEILDLFHFCPFCGSELPNIVTQSAEHVEPVFLGNDISCEELITRYFRQGFVYEKILLFLSSYHGIHMSLRTLKTKLNSLGLHRRSNVVDNDVLRDRIRRELDGPGNSAGYRSVWHTLTLEGIQVPRETVRLIVKELDPEGVKERRARTLRRRTYRTPGPNYVWHVDGYDKLKPYGFPVHGCIDGYSRKILWLKVSRTNNDPAVTGQHFLDAVEKYDGCPSILRTDDGTENVNMAAIQAYLRSSGEDDFAGANAHKYRSSPANQRIEAWWAFLRKNRSNWWINFFKDLIDQGQLNTADNLQKECLWFSFSDLIQADLNSVQRHWNSHYIRKSRFDTISGRPDELYFLPESSGATDHIQSVDEEDFQDMSAYCHHYSDEDNIFQEYFQMVKEQLGISSPTDWRAALDMYRLLCEIAQT